MCRKKFQGKTLLVLGSNVGSTDIVEYAKANGAHTIVADYYPPERSAAKQTADEHVLISTADLDSLSNLIKERSVDGVFAGIHEFNLLKAQELSKRFGLPFYCTREQWEQVESKNKFRKLCEKYHVPCPKTYYVGSDLDESDWEKICFPAVIKPVDGSASVGVFICGSREEMESHLNESLCVSKSRKVIVEEWVEGKEFTAHYTISNGKAALACVDNRYSVAVHKGAVTTVPIARIYPSVFLDDYIKQVNPSILDLCEGLELDTAILFVQGIYQEQSKTFHIFEAGLRCAGEAPYRFINEINGINAMELMTEFILGVKPDYDLSKEDPYLKGKCCGIVSFVAKGAIVGSILGLEEAVKATPSVLEYENRYPVGSATPDGDTLHQLMLRFVMICNSREQMAEDIRYLNQHITVLDTEGDSMVIKMEPESLFVRGGGIV